jgi:hypothetical protein
MQLFRQPGFWALLAGLLICNLTIAYSAASGLIKGRVLALPGIAMYVVAYIVIRHLVQKKHTSTS